VLQERENLYVYTREQLELVAAELQERVLQTPDNPISLGFTLSNLHLTADKAGQTDAQTKHVSFLGSMLFKRCVSGTRVIARGTKQNVAGIGFTGFGAHCDAYPSDYLTVAAALGTSKADVLSFLSKLKQCYSALQEQQ